MQKLHFLLNIRRHFNENVRPCSLIVLLKVVKCCSICKLVCLNKLIFFPPKTHGWDKVKAQIWICWQIKLHLVSSRDQRVVLLTIIPHLFIFYMEWYFKNYYLIKKIRKPHNTYHSSLGKNVLQNFQIEHLFYTIFILGLFQKKMYGGFGRHIILIIHGWWVSELLFTL